MSLVSGNGKREKESPAEEVAFMKRLPRYRKNR
jgi:hypothetical protein